MRIDTELTEEDRSAIKEYADANGYTMKFAYTNLLRSALSDRFMMRIGENGNIGLKFAGNNGYIMTNISREQFSDALESANGEWVTMYAPRAFAWDRVGVNLDIPPSIWDYDTDSPPKEKLEDKLNRE